MLPPNWDEPKNICTICGEWWEGNPYEYETDDHNFPCPRCSGEEMKTRHKKIRAIFVFADEILIYRGTKCRRYPADYYHRTHRITNIAITQGFKVIERRWDTEYRR
jgi:predicted RNA-binding Zn-ribbon protein involved in translation (DUF1610 family)